MYDEYALFKEVLVKKITALLALFSVLIIISGNVLAQSEATVLFLTIAPGARAGGLGETNVALANDAYATFFNPAGLGNMKGKEFSGMHTQWLPTFNFGDMYYDFASYVQHFAGIGTFGLSSTYVNWGEQEHTDETGANLGKFNSFEMAIGLSYGTTLSQNLAVGSTVKYIFSRLAPYSSGAQRGKGEGSCVAFDMGLLWKPNVVKRLSMGLNLQNLGPKMSYIDRDQADPLPTNLKWGFAYRALTTEYNKLTFLVDFNKMLVVRRKNNTLDPLDDKSDPFYKAIFTSWTYNGFKYQIKRITSGGGAEYSYNDQFFLRAGYFYEDIGKRRFATFGAGLRYSIYQFDFGYISGEQSHPLNETMRFSLSFIFNNR